MEMSIWHIDSRIFMLYSIELQNTAAVVWPPETPLHRIHHNLTGVIPGFQLLYFCISYHHLLEPFRRRFINTRGGATIWAMLGSDKHIRFVVCRNYVGATHASVSPVSGYQNSPKHFFSTISSNCNTLSNV